MRGRTAVLVLAACLTLPVEAVASVSSPEGVPHVERTAAAPIRFEPNQGQTDGAVRFLSRGAGYILFLTADEAVLAVARGGHTPTTSSRAARELRRRDMRVDFLKMRLLGSRPDAEVAGLEELPGRVNYLIGQDPARWRTGIPTYRRVHYRDVYPGIDLVYHGDQRELEYDFVVAPGADPGAIRLAFEGGARPEVDDEGHLVLHLAGGALRQLRPFVYQQIDGERRPVEARYVLRDGGVGFDVAAYDRTQPVVIDPVIVYSTYLGGSADDEGRSIAVDSGGNAYVTGLALSVDFPTTPTSYQPTSNGSYDVFVAKLNPSGSGLTYSTYIGGSSIEAANGIAVTATGQATLVGVTGSADFPTTLGAPHGGDLDAFVLRLNAAGNGLVYSRLLGGPGDDEANSLALDAAGNAYAVGFTSSTTFPTTLGALQPTYGGGAFDAFVTKLGPTGAIVFSTFLGGSDDDEAWGIGVDAAGNTVVSGMTASLNFPTAAAAQPAKAGGFDAFVAKLDATGSALLYSTYLGGGGFEAAGFSSSNAVALDLAGNAYVTGCTSSADFPVTSGAFQTTYAGGSSPANPTCGDMFVTKVSTAGALVWSTYIGGDGFDNATSIGIDGAGNAFVTGYTLSQTFPAEASLSIGLTGGQNIVVLKVNADGRSLAYSTLIGGNVDSWGYAVAVDPKGTAWVTGRITGTSFPTTPGAFQRTYTPPGGNAFVIKLDPLAVKNPGDQTSRENTTVVLQIEASGPVGDPLTYSAAGLPPGLTINAVTGTITGYLSFTSAGVYHPTVTVAHGTVTTSTTFTWTVLDVPAPANQPPVCTAARPSVAEVWPPNHREVKVTILGVTDPDGDPVTITITRVLQDEPTNDKGDGDTPIDGGGGGTSTAWVRAERSGKGDGRVYEIRFTATDGKGGACTGSVTVGVPHDQGKGPAVDSGVRYDSTVPGSPKL